MTNRLRTTVRLPIVAFSFVSLLAVTAPLQAAALQGIGALKFGMTPAEVTALEDCSSHTECLYDLFGKNRYFTLSYGPDAGTAAPSGDGVAPATLSHIDIEMGTYRQEWFFEVFDALTAEYPVTHEPTEHEQAVFNQETAQELTFGFADGFVLLKLVRRPFGNMIIHVVFQDAGHAQAQRDAWNAAVVP